jgi:hypothetical protein
MSSNLKCYSALILLSVLIACATKDKKVHVINGRTRLQITIQRSLGRGLVILSIVYILAAIAIYMSWSKKMLKASLFQAF